MRFLVFAPHLFLTICFAAVFFFGPNAHAQRVSTTTLLISVCGDLLVDESEDCDVTNPTGQYSTTIAGRQCTSICRWAPYCGDAILQTTFGEECDDGNNQDNDFCAADCTEEEADAGGGSSGGGGGSSSGGSDTDLGDTKIVADGKAYPNSTVNVLLDGDSIGTVQTNSSAEFTFSTGAEPGATTMGFWANDDAGTRSTTFSTTFEATQGAVTNVNSVYIPPTIRADDATVNPGDVIILSGQTVPEVDVEVSIDENAVVLTTTADASGDWTVEFDTSRVDAAEHIARARFVEGSSSLRTESAFGTALSLFVGVDGQPTSSSDLNSDGSVNLTDFSILVFWWGSSGGDSDPPADINRNGNVGLEDFSILLFNWTG